MKTKTTDGSAFKFLGKKKIADIFTYEYDEIYYFIKYKKIKKIKQLDIGFNIKKITVKTE